MRYPLLRFPYISTALVLGALATGVLLTTAPLVWGQEMLQNAEHPTDNTTSEIDPAAIEALKKMGETLAKKNNLAYDTDLITEVVLGNGQKILIGGKSRVRFRRPDHLRLELETDSFKRHLFHDGTTLTLFVPDKNYVGELEMQSDTRTALIRAAKEYGLEFPLMDLLEWGTSDAEAHKIQEAFLVGHTQIDGNKVSHWAIRGPRLDWEIWLTEGEQVLPLRMSTVNKSDPNAPRFFANIRWQNAGHLTDKLFKPELPEGAKRIPFQKVQPAEVKND